LTIITDKAEIWHLSLHHWLTLTRQFRGGFSAGFYLMVDVWLSYRFCSMSSMLTVCSFKFSYLLTQIDYFSCVDKTYATDDASDAVPVVFSPAAAASAADECETCQWAFVDMIRLVMSCVGWLCFFLFLD